MLLSQISFSCIITSGVKREHFRFQLNFIPHLNNFQSTILRFINKYVFQNTCLSLSPSTIFFMEDPLLLNNAMNGFDTDIIIAIPLATHTWNNAMFMEWGTISFGAILSSPIWVMNKSPFRWLSIDCFLKRTYY